MNEEKEKIRVTIPQHVQDALRSVSVFPQSAIHAMESVSRSIQLAQKPFSDAVESIQQAQKMMEKSGVFALIKQAEEFVKRHQAQQKELASGYLEVSRISVLPAPLSNTIARISKYDKEEIIEGVVSRIENNEIRGHEDTRQLKTELFLRDALISREPTSLLFAQVSPMRMRILDQLGHSYVKTTDLARLVGAKNNLSLQQVIAEFNRILKAKLGLDQNLIEGVPGHGYRLNPNFKITRVR